MAARAQQPAMPVIGLLDPRSPDALADRLRAFHRGLKDIGYIERENVAIEYRWAENQMDRLPALAAELVRLRVGVIISPVICFDVGSHAGNDDNPDCLRRRRRPR